MFNFRTELQYRLQDTFIKEHTNEFASIEEGLNAFMQVWNGGQFADTVEMKLYDLFEAAEQATDPDEAAPIYEQILALEPTNVDAKRELIGTLLHTGQQIRELEALMGTLTKPRKLDWYDITARSYIRCLIDLANAYLDNGLYQKAIDMFTPIFHGDKENHSDYLLFMMIACCGAGNWDRGCKVFARYLDTVDDIRNMMMHHDITLPMHMLYILLALQCGESKLVRDEFAELLELYEDIAWILEDATRWNDLLLDVTPLIDYLGDSTNIETEPQDLVMLHMTLSRLPMALTGCESVLWQQLYDFVKAITGRDVANRYSLDSFVVEHGFVEPMDASLEDLFQQFMDEEGLNKTENSTTKKHSANQSTTQPATAKPNKGKKKTDDADKTDTTVSDVDLTSPVYANLTTCQKKKLHAAGFTSFDDFGAVTKVEVLSIKGIGQKAVDNLVANGVVFKKA